MNDKISIELLEEWVETKRTQIGIVKRGSPRYEYEMGQKHLLNELSKFLDDNSVVDAPQNKTNGEIANKLVNDLDFIDRLAEVVANRIAKKFESKPNKKILSQDELTEIGSNKLINSAEVMERIGVSYSTLCRLVKAHEIPAPRKIGGVNRWSETDIESLCQPATRTPDKEKD